MSDLRDNEGLSLGIVKPREILDIVVAEDDDDWNERQRAVLSQARMFGRRKPLTKIPFKFRYSFTCHDPRCNGHRIMVEDWEIGALYQNELDRLGNSESASNSVRKKLLSFSGPNHDLHFFVGPHSVHRSWLIVGLFYPPTLRGDEAIQDSMF